MNPAQSGTSATIKTRLLIISDTHNAVPAATGDVGLAYREPLPSADVLLHAGDLTMSGYEEQYQATISMLQGADAELKLVIAGNHDVSLDASYYLEHGKTKHPRGLCDPVKMKTLWTSDELKSHGIFYLEEGLHTFTLKSGASFTAS